MHPASFRSPHYSFVLGPSLSHHSQGDHPQCHKSIWSCVTITMSSPSLVPSQVDHTWGQAARSHLRLSCFRSRHLVQLWGCVSVVTDEVWDQSFALSCLSLFSSFLLFKWTKFCLMSPSCLDSRGQSVLLTPSLGFLSSPTWSRSMTQALTLMEEHVLPIKVTCCLFIRVQFLDQAPFVN